MIYSRSGVVAQRYLSHRKQDRRLFDVLHALTCGSRVRVDVLSTDEVSVSVASHECESSVSSEALPEKEYLVTVRGEVAADTLDRLANGSIRIYGRCVLPCRVEVEKVLGLDGPAQRRWARGEARARPGKKRTVLRFVLLEGRNRQIRRMCRAVRLDVEELVRTRIGHHALGTLPLGKWTFAS
jgi:pseudouridine synthase